MIKVNPLLRRLLSFRMQQLPLEIRLLLAGCSPNFADLLEQNKAEFLSVDLNWEFLFNFATYHQLKYLFYYNCKSTNLNIIPSSFLPTLRRDARINTIRNLKLTQELNHLIKVFKEAEIPILPYKGTLLTAALYPDSSVRYCHDIDLFVSPEKFTLAKNVLLSLGYQLKCQYPWEESFIQPDTQIEVDLHQNFTPSFFSYDLNFSDCWQNKKPVINSGIEIDTLSSEDLLTLLCIQFTKDTWERQGKLIKLFDLAYFLNTYSHLDWQQEHHRISSLGLNNPFLFCNLMVQQICYYNPPFSGNFFPIMTLYAFIIYQHLIQFPPVKYDQKNLAERLIDKMILTNRT